MGGSIRSKAVIDSSLAIYPDGTKEPSVDGLYDEKTRIDLKENTAIRFLSEASGKRFQVLAGAADFRVPNSPSGRR